MPSKSLDAVGQTAGSPLKKRLSTKTIVKLWLVIIVVIALIGYLTWDIIATGPLVRFLTNRDELIASVKSWGIFAPLLFILLQVLQTVVAPIPGQVVGSIGGFIFGPWEFFGHQLAHCLVVTLFSNFRNVLDAHFWKRFLKNLPLIGLTLSLIPKVHR